MRRLLLALVALVISALAAVPAAAQTDQDAVVVTALHAIPGPGDFPADVYLNGELAIEGLTRMMRTDPFNLDPGEVTVSIYPAGADPAVATPAVEEMIALTAPGNYALVAHLTDGGQPVIAVYVNDLSPVPVGHSRLVFRQTADVGEVDVILDDETIASALPNTGEITVEREAGPHTLRIVPSGGDEPLIVSEVALIEGELTALFAISTMNAAEIDLAVQIVTGLQSTPSALPTGNGGAAAPDASIPAIFLVLLGVAALGMGIWLGRS